MSLAYVDIINTWLIDNQLIVAIQLIVFTGFFFYWLNDSAPVPIPRGPLTKANQTNSNPKLNDFKNPMQAPDVVLNAPLDTPYTTEQLKQYNGLTEGKPIYVAMKGIIFDGPFSLSSFSQPSTHSSVTQYQPRRKCTVLEPVTTFVLPFPSSTKYKGNFLIRYTDLRGQGWISRTW